VPRLQPAYQDVVVLATSATVHLNLTLDFAMNQGTDVVWWQLFDIFGQRTSLEEVRVWVADRRRANGGAS
jgi:hypothetical protein